MANKNHALDSRITDSAFREFMEKGYEKASLRKIAADADVTIGAIYTRYETKDALFCSLAEPLISRISSTFQAVKQLYYQHAPKPEEMSAMLQNESEAILHVLFDDYDRAVLLLCKSTGSSLEHFSDLILERKLQETASYFEQTGMAKPDPGVLKLLISGQFHMYFEILKEGCELEEAKRMMRIAMIYHTGGWMTLFSHPESGLMREE